MIQGETHASGKGPQRSPCAGSSWSTRATCIRKVVLEDASGKILDFYYLPEKAHIEVNEGTQISAGTLLAKTPRRARRTSPAVCRA